MSLSFASVSVHGFVNSVGAYVGLGSLLAVALLVILYFAHARETATLRDRLDEAQQRISGLEGRIAQLMQMQSAQRGRGPVAPAPAPVAPPAPIRAPGAPQGSVRRVPNPATAAGGASSAAALAQAPASPRGDALPAAPAGVAGPALASATKLLPDPAPGASDDTMYVPAAAAAANGNAGEHTAVLAAAPATPKPAAAASARVASASPRGSVAPPPRVQIGADQSEDTEAPVPAAAGSSRVRRIGGHPQAPTVSLPAFDDQSVGGGGRFSGALLPLMIAGVAVIVIIAGLIVITNSGGGTTGGTVNHGNTGGGTTGQTLHNNKPAKTPFNAASYKVAVLNGTAQSGLAGDVGSKLTAAGFKRGNITNAASQTQGLTFVYYVSSNANKIAAQHVAKTLTLPASRVHKAGASVIQSCTISATGASLGSCSAQVIVSVGQDRVTLATG
jgi:hypothetical protein